MTYPTAWPPWRDSSPADAEPDWEEPPLSLCSTCRLPNDGEPCEHTAPDDGQ